MRSQPLAHALDQRVTTVVGGLSMSRQIDALRRGVDVVVATPGRLIDLMERNSCQLGSVEITVIDEADHMADLGFLPAVRQILDATPNGTRSGCCCRPRLDGGVDKLVRDYLTDPAFHAVAQTTDAATAMDHKVFTMRGEDKVARRQRDRPAPGAHAVLRAHQARCRPAGQAAVPGPVPRRRRSTAT